MQEPNRITHITKDSRHYTFEDQGKDEALFAYSSGLERLIVQDYSAAVRAFNRVVQLEPKNKEALIQLGIARSEMGELEKAREDFTKVISLDSKSSLAFFERAKVKYRLDDVSAILDLDQAIILNPHYGEALLLRAAIKVARKDYKGAKKEYTKIIRADSKCAPEALLGRGDVKAQNGDPEGAIKDYTEALSLKPKLGEALLARALINAKLNRSQKALEDFNAFILLDQNVALAFFGRGEIRMVLEDLRGAYEDLDRAIALKSNYGEAFFKKGLIRFRSGYPEDAILDFSEAIKYQPQLAEAFYARAMARVSIKQYEEAIADFDIFIGLSSKGPEMALAYYHRGKSKHILENNTEALTDCQKALSLKIEKNVRKDVKDLIVKIKEDLNAPKKEETSSEEIKKQRQSFGVTEVPQFLSNNKSAFFNAPRETEPLIDEPKANKKCSCSIV